MLAYLFWHVPAPEVAIADYEERLAAFHRELRADAPGWLGPTATVAVAALPWLGGAAGYEDWYLVEDFAALGALNTAAVSGPPKQPHDAAAAAMLAGVGGVVAQVLGPQPAAAPAWAAWLSKPAGMEYEPFHAELAAALPSQASAWRRQMVLGPAPEYCVLAGDELALPWPAEHVWRLRAVVEPE